MTQNPVKNHKLKKYYALGIISRGKKVNPDRSYEREASLNLV